MSNILPNLFLGSVRDAKNKFPQFNHILSISARGDDIDIPINNHYKYNFNDDFMENIIPWVYRGADLIEQILNKNETVLVHCQMGISRSASIIIGYLMLKKNMSYDDAFMYVKTRRDIINPNGGFQTQLKSLCPKRLHDSLDFLYQKN